MSKIGFSGSNQYETTDMTPSGYICGKCGEWVSYGILHGCGPQYQPTPIATALFPQEIIELLREIRDLLKEKK